MPPTNGPVQVTARQLITVLRKEAAAFSHDRQLRDVLANIAARDMVSAGQVRIIAGARQRAA
jgi:hypothetical protein